MTKNCDSPVVLHDLENESTAYPSVQNANRRIYDLVVISNQKVVYKITCQSPTNVPVERIYQAAAELEFLLNCQV